MRAKVLVVDDSASDRLIIKNMLQDFDVVTANDGAEAMTLIQKHHDIDLIILDLNMPIMNGFEVLDAIKLEYQHRKMRIIILTNHDEIENEIRGLRSGAVDYIRKPIHMESLIARIDIHIELQNIQRIMEQKLTEQSFTFDTIFYEAPIGIAISLNEHALLDSTNDFLRINPMFEKITGYSMDDLKMLGWASITHPDDVEEDLMNYKKLLNKEIHEYAMDKRYIKPDGTIVWVHMVVARLKLLKDHDYNHISLIQDISLRKEVEAKLQESERSKSVLLSHLPGLAYRCMFDIHWTMKYVSDGCLELTGYPCDALIDNKVISYNDIVAKEYREILREKWDKAVNNDEKFSYEYEIVTADDHRKWVLEIGKGVKDKEGNVEALEGLVLDITERKEMENNLRHNSEHDSWTGLYNLHHLMNVLERDKDLDVNRALIGINVSDIHYLTTTYGFQYTIEIKKKLANALIKLIQGNNLLFNIYENHFVFYYQDYLNSLEIIEFCNEIINVMHNELSSERIGGGIGIVEIHEHKGLDKDQLLKNLLIASERAIDEYDRDFGIEIFDENLKDLILREENIKNELQQISMGLNQDRLILHYQPILDIKTNKVIGFEALSRLSNSESKMVSPIEFIPISEKTKLIIPLGEIIISRAFKFLKAIEKLGFEDIIVSINISAIQMIRKDFVDMVFTLIEDLNVDAKNVVFEMTESVFASNFNEINETLRKLQDSGIKIALDDFGTGYSTLARERELNVNTLKIDKKFIDKLMDIDHNHAITGSVIMMAHKLGHSVIAEGVEDLKQLQYLKENDCDMVQGFYFSKPLEEEKALEYLKQQN